MAITVGQRALRTAVRQHHEAVGQLTAGDSPTSALLLFYATECALKAALMSRMSLADTSSLADEYGHDLARLAKELNLSNEISIPRALRTRHNRTSSSIAMKDAHQAWRYGETLRDEDHVAAIHCFRQIIDWYKRERGGAL
ncbi:hypothetical protein AB2L28_10540 [Kineococcus sp. TBRC 1896]|uniref:HEPN domain-containing protein n=1 Tax=Kineococcus mangrovi TaxID=1660183 RepID=A0ABV4I5W2_9ACTN